MAVVLGSGTGQLGPIPRFLVCLGETAGVPGSPNYLGRTRTRHRGIRASSFAVYKFLTQAYPTYSGYSNTAVLDPSQPHTVPLCKLESTRGASHDTGQLEQPYNPVTQ